MDLGQDRSVVQVEYTITVPHHEIEACCHKTTGVDRKRKKTIPGQRFSNRSPKPQGWVRVGWGHRAERGGDRASHEDCHDPSTSTHQAALHTFSL